MAALKAGDYDAFGEAIEAERAAINALPHTKKRNPSKKH